MVGVVELVFVAAGRFLSSLRLPRRGRTGRKEGEKTRCLFIEQWDKLWNDDNDSRHKTEAVGFIGDTKMCSGVQTLQKPQRRATPRGCSCFGPAARNQGEPIATNVFPACLFF